MIPIPSVLSIKAVIIAALAALLLGLLIGGGIAWKVQAWRLGNQLEAQKAAFAEAALAAERKAADEAAALQRGVDDARTRLDVVAATIDAKDNEISRLRVDLGALRAAADRLRRDAGGLRNQLAEYARGAEASHAACVERVNQLARLADRGDDLLREGAERVATSLGVAEEGRTALQRCGRDHATATAQVKELVTAWPTTTAAAPSP